MTDLAKFKAVWDELGIRYHELTENGYTYITKWRAHDAEGKMWNSFKMELEDAHFGRDSFFEFDEEGKLVSW